MSGERRPFPSGHEVRTALWAQLEGELRIPKRVTIEYSPADYAAVTEAFSGPGELTEGGGPFGCTLTLKLNVRHENGTITVKETPG